MSDHILVLTDAEARLLGVLYSLGAMSALAVQGGPAEDTILKLARTLAAQMLETIEELDRQTNLRKRITALVEEIDHDNAQR